jgi:anti-anti-sigma factor
MTGMQVTEDTRAGWHLVSVSGKVDSSTADSLSAVLRQAVATHTQVAVNCSAIDFISSVGVGLLVDAAMAARRAGQRFSICTPSARVDKILRLCKLDTLLTIESTLPF